MPTEASLKNLKPWGGKDSDHPPPKSPGAPRKKLLTAAYEEQLAMLVPAEVRAAMKLPVGSRWSDAIAVAMVRKACRGNHECARELADRVEGKSVTQISVDSNVAVEFCVEYATQIPGLPESRTIDVSTTGSCTESESISDDEAAISAAKTAIAASKAATKPTQRLRKPAEKLFER